jgi:hypothetical protein
MKKLDRHRYKFQVVTHTFLRDPHDSCLAKVAPVFGWVEYDQFGGTRIIGETYLLADDGRHYIWG